VAVEVKLVKTKVSEVAKTEQVLLVVVLSYDSRREMTAVTFRESLVSLSVVFPSLRTTPMRRLRRLRVAPQENQDY
jgi:hypothetical protein